MIDETEPPRQRRGGAGRKFTAILFRPSIEITVTEELPARPPAPKSDFAGGLVNVIA